jgi:uncharacterized protein (DUF1501 family)
MARTTRRAFIRKLALGADPVVPDAGKHTLVCVFLRGGADTLNMLVPFADDEYYRIRPTISIPAPAADVEKRDAAIRLDDLYSLHPKLRPLLPAFREGRFAFVQAVGTDNTSGSHFEAQDQMEHGEAYGKSIGGGWLARHLRARASRDATPFVAVAIGTTIPESLRGAPSVSAISSVDEVQLKTPSGDAHAVSRALAAMYGADVGLLSQPGRQTLDLLARVEALRAKPYAPSSGADYSGGEFAAGLREIARLIKAEVGLEIASIDLGGWDTHFIQGTTAGLQASVIDELARGLAAFDCDLKDRAERVTVLVMTEFGRRTYENSSFGTDHGRGFALMALGGRINGGRVLGDWPGFDEEEGPGPGGLKVNFDYRSVLAEVLGRVFGSKRLDKVFPGFTAQPVGLMA